MRARGLNKPSIYKEKNPVYTSTIKLMFVINMCRNCHLREHNERTGFLFLVVPLTLKTAMASIVDSYYCRRLMSNICFTSSSRSLLYPTRLVLYNSKIIIPVAHTKRIVKRFNTQIMSEDQAECAKIYILRLFKVNSQCYFIKHVVKHYNTYERPLI